MKIHKKVIQKPDGRYWIQYGTKEIQVDTTSNKYGLARPDTWEAPTVRYNAMRGEYVAISASRMNRPFLPPKEYCPLCPAKDIEVDGKLEHFESEVPENVATYEWAVFENMYPALSKVNKTGRCEVVLYSPEHDSSLADQSKSHIQGLVKVWQDRSQALAKEEDVEQVFIFENRGEEIGVTLNHPHGQIYAYHHIPAFLKQEQSCAKEHHEKTGECLICHMVSKELNDKVRVIQETDNMVAFVPEAARFPYEVHISSKSHIPHIHGLSEEMTQELATLIKGTLHRYNTLFNQEMPYIMAHHQSPAKNPNDPTYHWHMELYPFFRSANKLKYLAGSESGAGFFVNDSIPEAKAEELKKIPLP